MILEKCQCDYFVRCLVNDNSINDYEWEKHYQHLRDDLCYENDLNILHDFHFKHHGINVKELASEYGII